MNVVYYGIGLWYSDYNLIVHSRLTMIAYRNLGTTAPRPRNHNTFIQCWLGVGLASQTVNQRQNLHWVNQEIYPYRFLGWIKYFLLKGLVFLVSCFLGKYRLIWFRNWVLLSSFPITIFSHCYYRPLLVKSWEWRSYKSACGRKELNILISLVETMIRVLVCDEFA